MARSTINPTQKKKRGRPPSPEGQRISIPISFSRGMVIALDAYAEKAAITRSEAVRRLIELGLKRVTPKAR